MPEMDNPRKKKYISDDDKLLQLETKLRRLMFGIIVLAFLFVGLLVTGVMVQIFFNSRPCCMSPAAPLPKEGQQENAFSSTSLDAGAEHCCGRLSRALETLESDLKRTLQQETFQNEEIRKIKEKLSELESAIRTSARGASVPARTFFEAEKKQFSGGEAAVTHAHPPMQKEPLKEEINSGDEFIFQSGGPERVPLISDDEDDLGSGCQEFARPVCPDNCLDHVVRDGCPVPVCCTHSVVQPARPAQQGHHHHH